MRSDAIRCDQMRPDAIRCDPIRSDSPSAGCYSARIQLLRHDCVPPCEARPGLRGAQWRCRRGGSRTRPRGCCSRARSRRPQRRCPASSICTPWSSALPALPFCGESVAQCGELVVASPHWPGPADGRPLYVRSMSALCPLYGLVPTMAGLRSQMKIKVAHSMDDRGDHATDLLPTTLFSFRHFLLRHLLLLACILHPEAGGRKLPLPPLLLADGRLLLVVCRYAVHMG